MRAGLAQVPFPDWGWLTNPRTLERVQGYTVQHLELTVSSVVIGLVIAVPLALLAVRHRRLYTPLLSLTGILFTIPSLALFMILGALYGSPLATRVSITGLAIYSLLILFRNTVAGLDSVPREVRESAEALGHTRRQLLWRVELPLALPVVIAGIRVAVVTTIGLVTITALIGQGGLGRLFITGFNRANPTILGVGVLGCALLAFAFDLALVGLQRWLLPWTRSVR